MKNPPQSVPVHFACHFFFEAFSLSLYFLLELAFGLQPVATVTSASDVRTSLTRLGVS